jgi:adenylyltransferase/sulfurtransferase
MTPAVAARDERLSSIPWLGSEGLAALRAAKVAIVGLGNVGGQLAYHLALLGVRLVLIDRGLVEPANLGTQGFDTVGIAKVDAQVRRLAPLNPFSRIEPMRADIRQIGMGVLRDASLLVSCTDNPTARIAMNTIAMRLGLAWLDGALDGSGKSLFGRVAAYGSGGACYLCPHDGASLAGLLRKGAGAAGCSGAWRGGEEAAAPSTLAVSALGGAVASLLAVWSLRTLLGRGGEVLGREVYFDLDGCRMGVHRLARNACCLADHRRYELLPVGAESTVGQAFQAAETLLAGPGEVSLYLQSRTLVARLRCALCGAEKRPWRVAGGSGSTETACVCGEEMQPTAADLVECLRRDEVEEILSKRWAELGLPAEDVIVAVRGDRELALLLA